MGGRVAAPRVCVCMLSKGLAVRGQVWLTLCVMGLGRAVVQFAEESFKKDKEREHTSQTDVDVEAMLKFFADNTCCVVGSACTCSPAVEHPLPCHI